jgi:hypothetical protein
MHGLGKLVDLTAGSIPCEVIAFFSIYITLPAALWLWD